MLITLIVTVIGLLLVLGVASRLVLHSGFLRLEQQSAEQELGRMRDMFDQQCDRLERKVADWALWDDMYRYVVEPTTAFSDANLLGVNLRTLQVNMLLIHDRQGELVHGSAYDLLSDQVVNVDGTLRALLQPHHPALQITNKLTPQRFIVRLGDKALLLSSWPILTSAGDGEPHGTIIMARWMNDDWVSQLSQVSHRLVNMIWRDQLQIPEQDAVNIDGAVGQTLIRDNADRMRGFVRIPTMEGESPLIIQVPFDRAIMQQGEQTFLIFLLVMAGACGALIIVVHFSLDWAIVSRLSRLCARVAEINQTNDQVGVVNDTAPDELGSIGTEVNRLLATQRGWRDQVASRNASMSLIFNTLPIGLLTLDANGCVQPERSQASSELLGCFELDGVDLGELISPGPEGAVTRRRLLDFLQLVRVGNLTPEELEEVNPVKMVTIHRADFITIIRCRFYRIDELNGMTRRLRKQAPVAKMAEQILVTIEDVSDEQRLAAEVARSQSDYQQLKAMAEDVDLFHSFINAARSIITELSTSISMLGDQSNSIRLQDIQRSVRRLIQGGEIFGLAPLHLAAKKFDTELVGFLGMSNVGDTEVRRCRYGVADLEGAVNQIERQFRTLVGLTGEDDGHRPMGLIRQVAPQNTPEEIRIRKRRLLSTVAGNALVVTRVGLASIIRSVPLMARRRELEVRFTVLGEEVPMEQHTIDILLPVLPHLLRFILDQGMDSPEERRQAKKLDQIALTLSCERQAEQIIITLVDDGHGINPQTMRRKAVEQNLLTDEQAAALSDQNAKELVFTVVHDDGDGSESGVRYVGINLIVQRLRDELQASVTVQSTIGHGTAIIIAIPLIKY